MYVTPILAQPNVNRINLNKRDIPQNRTQQIAENKSTYPIYGYAPITFNSVYKIKQKKINIDVEKNKLLKQISEILETNSKDTEPSDLLYSALKNYYNNLKVNIKKEFSILNEIKEISANPTLNPQQKQDRYYSLKKEISRINTTKKKKAEPQKQINDEKIDYELLNKFRTGLIDNNFNFRKITKEHFSELATIKTIDELKEKYPKIYTPPRPENIVAQKIEATLPKEFYEDLKHLFETSQTDTPIVKHIIENIQKQSSIIAKKYNLPEDKFFEKIGVETNQAILNRIEKLSFSNDFSSIPTRKQIKIPQVTELDIKLLSLDYDDFVTSVIKKHYLEGERLNDITYTYSGLTISPTQLKSSEYKFEKFPEKTKSFIKTADNLLNAQRDYDNFDIADFKARLSYYANQELSNNEDILRNIIDFDSSNFIPEDLINLKQFLKALDSVTDGEKPVQEIVEKLNRKELQPQGTQKLNELERKKTEENLRKIQQEAQKLNLIKHEFDEAINLLYINNLNNLAKTCSKYKPTTLNPEEIDKAKFLIELAKKNVTINKRITNKEKLEKTIIRWDTYNQYKNNKEESFIYEIAKTYAKKPDGTIDIDKAGQYLSNYQIVEMYPDSLEFTQNPEILEKLMSKTDMDKRLVAKYLTKFEDYQDLTSDDKSRISQILNIFDVKNSDEKILLKQIIEKDYINTDTRVSMNTKSANESHIASISSKAKYEIISKYKFPTCIDYFRSFEEALSNFATDRNTSGIKKISKNNEGLKYKMELKIMGEDDRLFSSNNNYVFDIFSDRGLH